ncbi:MAG: Hsp20/alpha crystallin family protein [Anaerolineae bacterium]|jgi:HSP20 family protein|nr:Hsp20/alpha crystallin family protein [Anaerolineae bacterium]
MANLVRWEPFRDLVSLREAMDRLFEESFVQSRVGWPAPVGMEALAVDMYETDDVIVVKTAVPGVKPEDLDVSIVGDTLTIRGETKAEGEIKKENYIRRERRCGSFCRSLVVPLSVVADEAEAEFENGILTLTLPKAEEVKPKAIKVKAKSK